MKHKILRHGDKLHIGGGWLILCGIFKRKNRRIYSCMFYDGVTSFNIGHKQSVSWNGLRLFAQKITHDRVALRVASDVEFELSGLLGGGV